MNIGIIGIGNMGGSILKGLVESEAINAENINIFEINKMLIKKIKYNINVFSSEIELVQNSDIIILAVKPNIMSQVLEKIKTVLDDSKIVLSIAAGISIDYIEKIIGKDKKIVRTMPNTPDQVLEAMTAVSFNDRIDENDKYLITRILECFGKSVEIEEKLMHAYTGISGSLPAYVYMFIEALADGGVLEGISRDKAYEIISQTILGSAKIVLETKKHPGQLKDEVTSPGGTTIEAVKVLENGNFRGTVIEAVRACTEKSKKMAGEK